VDMKLEVVVVLVSDVDRAKDLCTGPDFRVIQMTPPGSGCAIISGTGITSAAPGAAQGLTTCLPGRATSVLAAYGSLTGLAEALCRAAAAHGKWTVQGAGA
jgi:hypothetical protein